MAEDLGERSEDATPKRLREAREEGNVPRSTDAAAAVVLLGVTLGLYAGLTPLLGVFARIIRSGLDPANSVDASRLDALAATVNPTLAMSAIAAGPALLVAAAIGYFSHVWQVGFLISSKSLRPKPERLNPLAGAKRLLGPQGLVKVIFDLIKVAAVVGVSYAVVRDLAPRIVALPALESQLAMAAAGWMLFDLAIRVAAVLLVLGLLDFAWQRFKHARDLRMTKQQIKEEYKQTEGDPEVKRRRMQIQRQIAMQRIGTAVPKADVIVTNPEHLSVAIAYDAETMRAPTVVAMGADHLALRIRHIAKQHGVPIVERKPLARALYRSVKVGQEVPPDLYKAVAEVLAYVYRLDQLAGGTAGRRRDRAKRPVAAPAARAAG